MRTEEFWFETIQNDLYRMVSEYIKKEDINQTQFAEKLGVSKGYVSQILNGNFNATLKKLIELSLAVDKAPVFDFKNLKEFIKEDRQKRVQMQYQQFFNLQWSTKATPVYSGITANFENVDQTGVYVQSDAA